MTAARIFRPGAYVEQHSVCIADIQWNGSQRSIAIGHTIIGLTPTEYRILSVLRHGMPVSYLSMARQAYQYTKLDEKARLTMDKHVERIRGKLRGTGIYLYCVLGYGYLLLPEVLPEGAKQFA